MSTLVRRTSGPISPADVHDSLRRHTDYLRERKRRDGLHQRRRADGQRQRQ